MLWGVFNSPLFLFSHTFNYVLIYTRTIPLKISLPIPKFNNINISFLCNNIIYKLNKILFPGKNYHYQINNDCKNYTGNDYC